jgi:DNA polymerase V
MGAIENEMSFAHLVPGSILIKMVEATVNGGFPSPAQDYSEEEVDLIKEFGLQRPSVFVMRVTGNSMEGKEIFIPAGALITVDRAPKAKPGDIVVAVLNGEFTLKTLRRENGKWVLHAENPSFKSIIVQEEDVLEIWGVVDLVLWRAKKGKL